MGNDPLIPDERQAPFSAEIIDLAGVRVRLGRGAKTSERCEHKTLVYNSGERRIWCEDCEQTIDGFDAFMVFANNFSDMQRAARSKLAQAQEALAKTIHRRAAQALSRMWNGRMVPCCPHCHRGLLAEDFTEGASSAVSKELEVARRRKEKTDSVGEG